MIKITLTKDDKFLNLSSLIPCLSSSRMRGSSPKLFFNICLSVGCHTTIVDDFTEKDINECGIIFNLEADSSLKYSSTVCPAPSTMLMAVGSRMGMNAPGKSFSRDLTVNLLGYGSQANLDVKILSSKDHQINLTTKQVHLSSNTSSLLNIKNVMLKNSKFNCDNLIKIEKDLSEVTAIEISKVLSLVSDAQVLFKPKIEVDSQDVICKHEAAILCLNEEQLFYLQSRGMSLKQARDFLLKAFLN